ncbi:MAG: Uma2 family endonuclease [Verrucomicrobiota bacterium]
MTTDQTLHRKRFDPSTQATPDEYEAQGSLVLPGYTWKQYLSLDQLFHGSGVRVRFLEHHLEIMPPISESHETKKVHVSRLMEVHVSRLMEAWCLDRDIELFGRGSTTLKIPEEAGGEPDESYCIGRAKNRPDLVIEIALTSGGLSKRAFYAKFQVPELWIWRNQQLKVHVFDEKSGSYEEAPESSQLPGIDLKAIETCANLPSINQAVRDFRKLTSQDPEA